MEDERKQDIHVLYLMNGQIIFADYIESDADTDDHIVKGPLIVMLGQGKQIAMSTAYPFSNIEDEIGISWRQVTAMSSLGWNPHLIGEYNKFWTQLKAQAAGIILPGQGNTPPPMRDPRTRPTIVK